MAPTNPNRVAEPYEPFTKCDLGTEGCTDGCHTWGYVDGKTVAVCRCTPLLNLRDGEYEDITVPEPGHSFTCWGKMAEPVEFTYDGVEHTNDCNACHYTPLKGLIRWQENPTDWETFCTYYGRAATIAKRWPWVKQPGHHGTVSSGCGSYDLERNPETGEVRCAACGATGLTTGLELDNAG